MLLFWVTDGMETLPAAGADRDRLVKALAKEYEVEDAAGLSADVQELVEQLEKYGYLIDA